MQDIIESLTESGWKPYNKEETGGSLSEMNIEEVFQLVDINNSGYVTKTVNIFWNNQRKFNFFQKEIKLAANLLKKRYGIEKVWDGIIMGIDDFIFWLFQVTTWYSVMKFADENKNGNLSLREFKKLVELAEDMDRGKKKQENKKWRLNLQYWILECKKIK